MGKGAFLGIVRPPNPCPTQNHTRPPRRISPTTTAAWPSNPLPQSLLSLFSSSPHWSCSLRAATVLFLWHFRRPAYIIAASPEGYVSVGLILHPQSFLSSPSLFSGFYSSTRSTSYIVHFRCFWLASNEPENIPLTSPGIVGLNNFLSHERKPPRPNETKRRICCNKTIAVGPSISFVILPTSPLLYNSYTSIASSNFLLQP